MPSTTLRLTEFVVQRLRCIGGQGRAAPFQITTYHGIELGSLGTVIEAGTPAANTATFERSGPFRLSCLLGRLSR